MGTGSQQERTTYDAFWESREHGTPDRSDNRVAHLLDELNSST